MENESESESSGDSDSETKINSHAVSSPSFRCRCSLDLFALWHEAKSLARKQYVHVIPKFLKTKSLVKLSGFICLIRHFTLCDPCSHRTRSYPVRLKPFTLSLDCYFEDITHSGGWYK